MRSVEASSATVKIGPYVAHGFAHRLSLDRPHFASGAIQGWRSGAFQNSRHHRHDGDSVELEQELTAQGALLAIDNSSGEIKAMVGGSSFEESKFNRATQALRQTGSSFKVYVYATAIEQGALAVRHHRGRAGDVPQRRAGLFAEKLRREIRRAHHAAPRARRFAQRSSGAAARDRSGVQNVIDTARRFGITSPLPPYLPLALGAADLTLMEHVSAFTVFPDDGIHIEPHMIRRVTTYDGALLEEAKPQVTDVIPPDVARTMVAMLEEVVQFGTGVRAKELGRPTGGKDRHDQRFHRCVVHRLYAIADRGRVGRQRRQADFARQKRNRRARRASDLASVHEEARWTASRWKIFRMSCRWKSLRTARRPGGHAGHRSARRRRRAGPDANFRSCTGNASSCARQSSVIHAIRSGVTAEMIPAFRLQRLRPASIIDEDYPPLASDLADARQRYPTGHAPQFVGAMRRNCH